MGTRIIKPPKLARDIMVTDLVTLKPDMNVFDAIALLIKHEVSGAPVVDEQRRFIGIFTERCCMDVLIDAAYDNLPTATVDLYSDRNARTVIEDTDVLTIVRLFRDPANRRLPVLKDGRLVGQISRRDVIRVAKKLFDVTPDRAAALLYLSALEDRSPPSS